MPAIENTISIRPAKPMRDRLGPFIYPNDPYVSMVNSMNSYEWLYAIVAKAKPSVYVEIGTRYGYSALTALWAMMDNGTPRGWLRCFDAGFDDARSGETDSLEVARRNLREAIGNTEGFNARVTRCDTQTVRVLMDGDQPIRHAELVYVDGDHSFQGCANDLLLAHNALSATGHILADDVVWARGNAKDGVWKACLWFSEGPFGYRLDTLDTYTGLAVLHRCKTGECPLDMV